MNRVNYLAHAGCAAALLGIGTAATGQNINVNVNGQPVVFQSVGPQEVNGHVLVPLRGVLERLGATVDWSPATHTVIATKGTLYMQLPIGSHTALVSGRTVNLDVPAMTISGTTMVPLRFVGETLGAQVKWDAPSQTVLIQTSDVIAQTAPTGIGSTIPVVSATPDAPQVTSISQNLRDGWLRAGQAVHVVMQGTPGGNASFHIPGVTQDVAMTEVSPGVYQGDFMAPSGKPVQNAGAAIIGSLRAGGRAAPLIQAGDPLHVDTVPPHIDEVLPPRNAEVSGTRTSISASYGDDAGSGIAQDKVRLSIDGQDVTDQANVTGRFVSFTPPAPLPVGTHEVTVNVEDRAGNPATRTWTFNIIGQAGAIRSVTANTSGTLHAGDVLNVRAQGVPGGRAYFSAGPIKNVPLTEQSPGEYVGAYTIKRGEDISEAPVSIAITGTDGRKITYVSPSKVTVSTGPPPVPVVVSPTPGEKVGSSVTVQGRGIPNSTVRIKLDYSNKVFGLFAVRGTADQEDVKVAADGTWSTHAIDVTTLLGGHGTTFTLTAIGISLTGEQSAPQVVTFAAK